MSQTERLVRIDQMIKARGCVPFDTLQQALEVSRATLNRDLRYLRDRLNAPIVFDRERGGYVFAQGGTGPQYSLPGLWFSDRELLALLTMHRMLVDLEPGGLLGAQVAPLMARLDEMLTSPGASSAAEIRRRVRILPAQQRPTPARAFELVGAALVQRRRLEVSYWTRSRDERTQRELSPQRLVHWRNAWYLDAWCHRTGSLRTFSLDAIEDARTLDRPARDVRLEEVDRVLGRGYGIYGGKRMQWATLRFTAQAARWVASEIWHPQQRGTALPDGGWELQVPYGESPELEMDILRHGEQVEVISPPALRAAIARRLGEGAARYAAASPDANAAVSDRRDAARRSSPDR